MLIDGAGWLTDVARSQFRRSMKNEKHDSAKPVQIAIPSKDAIAIEPPKKVRFFPQLAAAHWLSRALRVVDRVPR